MNAPKTAVNVPNTLTVLRLLLVPCILWTFSAGSFGLACVLFIIAGATDFLDGVIARMLDQRTKFGATLDPIADKCLMSGIFLVFGALGVVSWKVVAVVFGRDLYIFLAALVLMAAKHVREFPPSQLGKASTLMQFIFIAVVLGGHALSVGFPVDLDYFAIAVVILAIGSGLDYTWRGMYLLRERRA
jgi:cardiolipin synthase (CMP-forming)